MSLGVHHLAVVVADLERAERFYAGVLGLRVLRRWADAEGRPRAIWLELAGGAFLALEKAAAAAGAPRRADDTPGWHCVALGIARAERAGWAAALAAAGHPVVRETAYTIYVRDPDGHLVGLSHHPDPV